MRLKCACRQGMINEMERLKGTGKRRENRGETFGLTPLPSGISKRKKKIRR
ncbi:hypothetical protein EVA_08363 [gut metagenome]|uniref:Uncharacterized protein n=1 Tax=gut metagenome TaxID=749906 RepID=J9CTL6_9ZZZZ